MSLTPPETLSSHHSCSDFSCGIASLDNWLKRRAYTNQKVLFCLLLDQ